MKVTLQSRTDHAVHLALAGSLTQTHTLTVGDPVQKIAGDDAYGQVVLLNMQGVGAIDSSGVNWLLQRRSRFRQEGGRLVLHSLPPTIENVLKMLRMQRVLEIAEDEASALAGLGEQLS